MSGPLEVDDNDPITASYSVFLNPALPAGRRLLILQQPNRVDPSAAHQSAGGGGGAHATVASELRLKPRTGMVELDVPLDTAAPHFDRSKGLRWGHAVRAAALARSGGSLGLAGGFAPVQPVARRRAAAAANGGECADLEPDLDPAAVDDPLVWAEVTRHDRVLRTQTLGGQCPRTPEVQYMVGVFRGDQLHLTPVSSLVHLRPQLHHVDAQNRAAATATPAGTDVTAAAGGAAPAGPATGGAGGGGGGSARAIHMTIKTAGDDGTAVTETMADRLRAVQLEPWRRLRYTDENDQAAWDVYSDSLFLATANSPAPPLVAAYGDDKLLQRVSGIKPPPAHVSATPVIDQLLPSAQPQSGSSVGGAGDLRPNEPVRTAGPRGARTAGTHGRGGRTRARGSTAMELD